MWRLVQRVLAKGFALASRPLEAGFSKTLRFEPPPALVFEAISAKPGFLTRVDEIAEGRFTFLSRTADYSRGIDWRAEGFDRLWRFNLHYFEFGLDLALATHATGNPRYAARFKEIAADWISRSPLGKGDAWHAYPLSLRLVNWIWAWHLCGEALGDFRPTMARSMALQARYLPYHLERDIGGNHLVKNLKALVMTGAFLGEATLVERGLRLLEAQVRRQVLPDGGHFERSPMYHVQVLQDLAETAWYLRATQGRMLPWLDEALRRMADWLCEMTLPDGEIALFGDSAHGIVPRPGAILALVNAALGADYPEDAESSPFITTLCHAQALHRHAQLPHRHSRESGNPGLDSRFRGSDEKACGSDAPSAKLLTESGFLVTRHQDQKLILDCGPFAPDELPAHGHCDALSFELALGAERFIVDSGTFAYTGPRRSHFRGTAAHNTVAIPGIEQTEIWGDFRAGRRARITERSLSEAGAGFWARAAHDGFRPRVHRRELWFVPGAFWLIRDTLEGDLVPGATSRLHIHPDRIVTPTPEGALLSGNVHTLQIVAGSNRLTWEEGAYSERFGLERPCRVLAQALDEHGTSTFLLVPGNRRARLRVESKTEWSVEFEDGARFLLSSGRIQPSSGTRT